VGGSECAGEGEGAAHTEARQVTDLADGDRSVGSKRGDFVQFMLWKECRHRRVPEVGTGATGEPGTCALALLVDAQEETGPERGNCQKENCPHVDQADVP